MHARDECSRVCARVLCVAVLAQVCEVFVGAHLSRDGDLSAVASHSAQRSVRQTLLRYQPQTETLVVVERWRSACEPGSCACT